ncbi:MAG: uroporphyrinogen-III synthase [Acidobacteria bacterium]|jgi:uroporphyrinogen-III synthase|nr:MAG: uroporphyrinogen-III synthase [Acidobacteriota bacterium]GIU81197.1 MAG: hypothetical protein KatS3mg006_0261 [Pyrinomonadaceae bacterium]
MLETFAIFQDKQNQHIIEKLSKASKVILLPKPTLHKTDAFTEKLEISLYDWLIFNDIIATEVFLEKIASEGFDFYDLDYLQICAIGEAVAERLRHEEIHCDIITSPNKVADSIADYVQKNDLENLRFLIITPKFGDFGLKQILCKKGAEAKEIQIYEFRFDETKNLTMLKTLIKGGAVDNFILNSPHEIVALKWFFQDDLHQALAETRIFAVDEITFRTLEEEGFSPRYFV